MPDEQQSEPTSSDKPTYVEMMSDQLLTALVDLINNSEIELEITLSVGGVFLSGILSSRKNYLKDLRSKLTFGCDAGAATLWDTWLEPFTSLYARDGEDRERVSPKLIHLRDAQLFGPGTNQPIPSETGNWWRGSLEHVDGFMMGIMRQNQRNV